MYSNLCREAVGIKEMEPEALIDLAARAGFGGVDFPLTLVKDTDHARDLGQQARASGLAWGLFWLPCDFPSVDDAAAKAGMDTLRERLPIVEAAGCRRAYNHVWPGDDELEYAPRFEQQVRRLAPVAKLLADHGVTYGLEFLGPRHIRSAKRYPFIHTLEGAIALADAVGSGAGIVFDFFHWYTSGGTVASAKAALLSAGGGRRIVNVHANDAMPGRAIIDQQDNQRAMPLSTGVIDAAGLMRMLSELSYDGPIMIEPFQPAQARLAAMEADAAAAEVAASLQALMRLGR